MTNTTRDKPLETGGEPPRVVLLTKRNHLGIYLQQRLANAGVLTAVLYETGQRSFRTKLKYARLLLRREGLIRMLDVVAYGVFHQVVRARELRAACETIIPLEKDSSTVPQCFDFADLNSPASVACLQGLGADVLVVHATGILKPATFSLARKLALNIHCGVLPEYRGHASTFWALRRGDFDNVGVSIHEVAAMVDKGRHLRIGRVQIGPDDTDITSWLRAFSLGVDLTLDLLRELTSSGGVVALPTPDHHGPHYRRRGLSDHLAYVLARWRTN